MQHLQSFLSAFSVLTLPDNIAVRTNKACCHREQLLHRNTAKSLFPESQIVSSVMHHLSAQQKEWKTQSETVFPLGTEPMNWTWVHWTEGKNWLWGKQSWVLKKVTMQELKNDRNGTNVSIRQPCYQNLFNLKKLQQSSCFLKYFVSVNKPLLFVREQTRIHRIREWIRLENTLRSLESNLWLITTLSTNSEGTEQN